MSKDGMRRRAYGIGGGYDFRSRRRRVRRRGRSGRLRPSSDRAASHAAGRDLYVGGRVGGVVGQQQACSTPRPATPMPARRRLYDGTGVPISPSGISTASAPARRAVRDRPQLLESARNIAIRTMRTASTGTRWWAASASASERGAAPGREGPGQRRSGPFSSLIRLAAPWQSRRYNPSSNLKMRCSRGYR